MGELLLIFAFLATALGEWLDAATQWLGGDAPLSTTTALMVWLCIGAMWHAWEETEGELWHYFGLISGNPWVERLTFWPGAALFVAPACALQCFAAIMAFSGGEISPFWLGAVIGLRGGDCVFSHIIPQQRLLPNPGAVSAYLYAVEAAALSAVYAGQFSAVGVIHGAAFFASVAPLLYLTRRLFRTRKP
jgi:hypothetical protein